MDLPSRAERGMQKERGQPLIDRPGEIGTVEELPPEKLAVEFGKDENGAPSGLNGQTQIRGHHPLLHFT